MLRDILADNPHASVAQVAVLGLAPRIRAYETQTSTMPYRYIYFDRTFLIRLLAAVLFISTHTLHLQPRLYAA